MWKEAVMAYFKDLSRNLPRGTQENNEALRIAGFLSEI
jgi:hypothetical protein